MREYPGPGGRWQVSTEGGGEPVWARSGRELFYRSGAKVIAATVRPGPPFAVERRDVLFEGEYRAMSVHAGYDVHPDGTRFLMVAPGDQSAKAVVVVNWVEELQARIAAGSRQ